MQIHLYIDVTYHVCSQNINTKNNSFKCTDEDILNYFKGKIISCKSLYFQAVFSWFKELHDSSCMNICRPKKKGLKLVTYDPRITRFQKHFKVLDSQK